MAAKSTTFANQILLLVFNNDAVTLVGDAAGILGSAVDGNLYISFHSANPTGGNQSTSELTYGAYARQPVARTVAGWTVTADTCTNVNQITFPTDTLGSQTINYVGIGTDLAGAGKLLYSVQIVAQTVDPGEQPYIPAGGIVVTET